MRKSIILFAAMACLAMGMTSCQKEEQSANLKFRATFEPTTGKCYYDPVFQRMTWDDEERITIFSGQPESPDENTTFYPFGIYQLSSMTDGVAEFDWIRPDTTYWGDYVVLNPYQTAKRAFTASDGPFYAISKSFGESPNLYDDVASATGKSINASIMESHYAGIIPMASYSTDMNLRFKHLCGVLMVNVSGIPEGYYLSRIEVASSNKYFYGPSHITFDASGIPTCAIDYEARADNDAQSEECGIPIADYSCDTYPGTGLTAIPLLPDTYDDMTLTFVFFDEFNDWQEYHVTKSLNTGSSITIQRARVDYLSFTFADGDYHLIVRNDD